MKLESAIKIIREQGIIALVKIFIERLRDQIEYYIYFLLFLLKIRNIKHYYNLEKLINFTFEVCSGLIMPHQIPDEIYSLAKILNKLKPKVLLEIGTGKGGTLFLLSRITPQDACIISIDLPSGYPRRRIILYKTFPLKTQQFHLIRADSHDITTLNKIKAILKGKKIDFLFIDGDHTYEGVKKDFELYSPLVQQDGLIVFHDILPRPIGDGVEVNKFWNEIKSKFEYKEIVKNWNQKEAGTGLIKKKNL